MTKVYSDDVLQVQRVARVWTSRFAQNEMSAANRRVSRTNRPTIIMFSRSITALVVSAAWMLTVSSSAAVVYVSDESNNNKKNKNLRGLSEGNFINDSVYMLPPLPGRERELQSTMDIDRSFLMIRIQSAALGEPVISANELYLRVFSDAESLKWQLNRCSAGQVNLNPTNYGVLTVPIDGSSTAMDTMVQMAQTNALNYVSGVSDIREVADHVMLILPPMNVDFVAKAEIGGGSRHSTSTFSGANAGSLSVLSHEIAHNLGLGHAWYNGDEYGDVTGYMGISAGSTAAPLSCYNAGDNWLLSWFMDARLDLSTPPDTPVTVTIAALTDYQEIRSYSDQYVIVKGGDIYMQYNRAKDYNSGTRAMPDQLVLVGLSGIITNLVTGLDPVNNPKYSNGNVAIQACAVRSSNNVDYMIVSIGRSYTDCTAGAAVTTTATTTTTQAPVASTSQQTGTTGSSVSTNTWWNNWS
jgi:Gametolysin peptidase M11